MPNVAHRVISSLNVRRVTWQQSCLVNFVPYDCGWPCGATTCLVLRLVHALDLQIRSVGSHLTSLTALITIWPDRWSTLTPIGLDHSEHFLRRQVLGALTHICSVSSLQTDNIALLNRLGWATG